jgi:small subunit ribosomal protein S16
MAVKIRLSRKGRKQAPFYHIVVADARSPRDGKFIEKIGTYNPMTKPATIEIDRTAAYDWLTKGAQPTDTVKAILRFKGVYYKKHLMRGVKKGALTVEQMDTMLQQWIDSKEGRIAARRMQTAADAEAFRIAVSGEPGKRAKAPVADASSEEASAAFRVNTEETAAPVSEATETAVEETPVIEAEAVAETVEEAPVAVEEAVAETVEEAVEEAPAAVEEAVAETVEETPAAVEEAVEETPAAVEEVVAEEAPAVEEAPEAPAEEA